MCDDNIQIGESVWKLKQESVEWHERRPWASASCSGGGIRVRQQLQTLVCFRHRWSSVCAVTKTGPELLSAWISGCARAEESSSPGEYPAPLVFSSLSIWHPQDKALHLPPFLFPFLNLHFLPSLPQPPSARTPPPYFGVCKCHRQPQRLCITGWLTADLRLCCVFFLSKHLEQTESRRIMMFLVNRALAGDRGTCSAQRKVLPIWIPPGAAARPAVETQPGIGCKRARVLPEERVFLEKWTKSEGRPHMQMLLCVVCCWFFTLLTSSFPWKGFGMNQVTSGAV